MGRPPIAKQQRTPGRHYVSVVADTSAQGKIRPLSIGWDDGRRFTISRVLEARQAVSRRNGASGIRFTVQVGPRVTYLWYEDPRWFVLPREDYMPE